MARTFSRQLPSHFRRPCGKVTAHLYFEENTLSAFRPFLAAYAVHSELQDLVVNIAGCSDSEAESRAETEEEEAALRLLAGRGDLAIKIERVCKRVELEDCPDRAFKSHDLRVHYLTSRAV